MKKAWERPRLVVLVKSKPEEMLISWCKSSVMGLPGAQIGYSYCWEVCTVSYCLAMSVTS
jgi:hypothetical protein